MIKTVKIGNKDIQLNNNIGWCLIYRDQFGQDIVQSLVPMMAGALDIVTGLINETGKVDDLNVRDFAKLADGESLINALAHLSGLEFADFINITWALAKCADPDIPEPIEWVKQFDDFPIDVIAPAVAELVYKGVVSSKNQRRLEDVKEKLQPNQSK